MKKLLIGIGVIAALLVACVLTVDRRAINRYVEQQIVALGGKAGVNLRFTDLSAGVAGLSAAAIDLFVPRALFMARVDSVSVRPGWFSLLSGRPGLEASGRAYEGSFDWRARSTYSGEELWCDGSLEGLRLSDHPQLSGLGITAGTLSLTARDVRMLRGVLMKGEIDLQISGLDKPAPTTVPVKVQQFPMNIQIPAFSDLGIDLALKASDGEIVIEQKRTESSLFAAGGRGALRRDRAGTLLDVEYRGSVTLTADGARAFGPFLPMISRGALPEDTAEFEYTVIGDPARPQTTFRRIR